MCELPLIVIAVIRIKISSGSFCEMEDHDHRRQGKWTRYQADVGGCAAGKN
jgi:hypothetical protein